MPCTAFGTGHATGHLPPGLDEVSGAVVGTVRPGVVWTIEDSGNQPVLHALSPGGADLGTVAVTGATNVDWEDLASSGRDLFIADIGDNRSRRRSVTVYRVPEPVGATAAVASTMHLAYPGGPTDAEALVVDPRSGDLVVLSKDWDGEGTRILRAPAAELGGTGVLTMRDEGEVALATDEIAIPGDDLVTGAGIDHDGHTIFVRTYGRVLVFTRRGSEPIADALRRAPCVAPSVPERQGEAIAAEGRGYLTLSEGAGTPIHRFGAAPIRRVPQHRRRPAWPLAALGGVVVVLLAVVLRRERRR